MSQKSFGKFFCLHCAILYVLFVPLFLLPWPAHASSAYEQALSAMEQGRYDESLALLEGLMGVDKKVALEGKLLLYKKLGDNTNVVATINEILSYKKDDIGLSIEKAIALRNLGGWEDAENIMSGVKDKIKDNPALLIEYGRYLLWKKDFEGAKSFFDKALALDPVNNEAKLGIAYYHVWKDDDQQAFTIVQGILSSNPQDMGATILYGWLLAWQGNFEESLKTFNKAMSMAPDHPEIIQGIAQNYAWDGQFNQSLDYYKQLIAIQPDNIDIMLQMGRIYREQGAFDEALEILKNALAKDPERIDVREELNIALKWTDQVSNSIRKLKQKLSLNQGNLRDYIELGNAFNWTGELAKAKETYLKALEKDPDNIQLLHGLARVYEDLEDLEKARDKYMRILELKPNYVDARVGLQRIKKAFNPAVTFQYGFDWYRDYDHEIFQTSTVQKEHSFTMDYTQRLHSMYTLSAGYTMGLADQYSEEFDASDYNFFHHQMYLLNQLNLSHNIKVLLRYDFHLYVNHNPYDNYYVLSKLVPKHGGYLVVQFPYKFNNFSFQFARSFFQLVSDVDTTLSVESTHAVSVSDDIDIAENVSALFTISEITDSLSNEWGWVVSVHPRFIVPFFPRLTLEYDLSFNDSLKNQNHGGIAILDLQIGPSIQSQVLYEMDYFSSIGKFSHMGNTTFSWIPIDPLTVSISGSVTFFDKDISTGVFSSVSYAF
ncbi:MAG: tetratricopeptide repeat protein [Deltaproteobacteria bacterium]|nr:tetratricopeptide repeat protein [Deltaproteobacteria bacterium]